MWMKGWDRWQCYLSVSVVVLESEYDYNMSYWLVHRGSGNGKMEIGDWSKYCVDRWSNKGYLVNVESEYKVEIGCERIILDKIVWNMSVNDNLREENCTKQVNWIAPYGEWKWKNGNNGLVKILCWLVEWELVFGQCRVRIQSRNGVWKNNIEQDFLEHECQW